MFPPSLMPRQRAALHALGEQHNLSHDSHGEGSSRHIRFGHAQGKQVAVADVLGASGAPLSDAQICQLLAARLNLTDTAAAFAGTGQGGSGSAAGGGRGAGGGKGKAEGSSSSSAAARLAQSGDVEGWVSETLALVEMERQAEVEQALEATAMCSPETAQASARLLGAAGERQACTVCTHPLWTGRHSTPLLLQAVG